MPVLLANATADAAGKATITFPAPGQGMAYCGTVIVPSTPGAATWTAVIGNATYGQWSGATSAGPFTENDQETLQLNGEGLTPGTTYVATWHITQGAAGSFRGVTPDVLPASVNITNASIKVDGSIDANITNASIPVAGSVTVESGTVDIGNTPAVTIESGSVDIGNTPAVTVDGPVGIAEGSSIQIVNSNLEGQTTPSPAGSTATGNATLSAVDYNLVAWDAVPLPAGSSGNLVYDSNLTNAIANVGPTWTVTASIGTSDGDINVLNPGTDSAKWVFYATGSAMYQHAQSQVIAVTPGSTYTLAGLVDAAAVTSGLARLMMYDPTGATEYGEADQTVGVSGQVSIQITIPSGVTEVIVYADVAVMVAPSGSLVTFSQIQLTQTSAVQTYEPGPLWTYDVYRETNGAYGLIGSTTALAFEDTGQAATTPPPTNNTSNPSLPPPGAPTITPEGTTGSTTYSYEITAGTTSASGTVLLGSNPGVSIGTIDIADGATVQIAAGDAAIGSVTVASGSIDVTSGTVDATIQNATLDVTGSTINVDGATQATSTFGTVNASAQDTVTGSATTALTTLIPAPSSSEQIQLFSGLLNVGGTSAVLRTTAGVDISPALTAGTSSLQYDGALLPAGQGVNMYPGAGDEGISASLNYSVLST